MQGLGKTITTIALILSHIQPNSKSTAAPHAEAETPQMSDGEPERCQSPRAGTLIVCPSSVALQWMAEIAEKVGDHFVHSTRV